MKKLSEYKPVKPYAYCCNCIEWFIDDLPIYGSIHCPNADCKYALERGFEEINLTKP